MRSSACFPPVLFGAFDRHNFGDLLFPHLMTALLPGRAFAFAGLAERDLRAFGGHRVSALRAWGDARPRQLIHAGGELLGCTAWQAAVMLLDPDEAESVIARYDADPDAAAAWAAHQLGTSRLAPYVAGRDVLAPGGNLPGEPSVPSEDASASHGLIALGTPSTTAIRQSPPDQIVRTTFELLREQALRRLNQA